MRAVLSDIKSRLPSAPLALVGASLGANMVIKFLGEEGSGSRIWGAVAIGCPFDLLVCDRFMNRTHVQVGHILTIFFGSCSFENAPFWSRVGLDG
jgi:abhydrolase domain-containing protein 1/3